MIRHFTFDVSKEEPLPAPENPLWNKQRTYDITAKIESYLSRSGISNGSVKVQTLHTTLSLGVNENEDGLIQHDFPRLFHRIAPAEGCYYRHDDFEKRTVFDPSGPERVNGPSHCKALAFAHLIEIIIMNGTLRLGTWQKLLVFDHDGHGRETARELAIMFNGE